jgi:hypothetical protein
MISHACTSISPPVVSWRADIDGTGAYNYALKNIKGKTTNNKQNKNKMHINNFSVLTQSENICIEV